MTGPARQSPPHLGPAFALDTTVTGPGWIPITTLARPRALADRVEHSRAAFGVSATPQEIRAVASTMALGLFSRLLSPVVAAALLGEGSLRPDPATTWVRPVESGSFPLATTAPLVPADLPGALERLVMPLLDAISSQFAVSGRILLGDVAAAIVGACDVVAAADPDRREAADDLRAAMLTRSPLRGTGTVRGPFIRSSCCLMYQLPMHYICSHCILVDRRTRTIRRRPGDIVGSPEFRRRYRQQLQEARDQGGGRTT